MYFLFISVLGFPHAHCIYNRDDYVRYIEDNLRNTSFARNFKKFPIERHSDFGLGYDYNSIMHYPKNAFSKNSKLYTLIPLDINYLDIIGQRERMSDKDIQKINLLYSCSGEYTPYY